MSYGFDDQTEAWLAEQIEKLPHQELGEIAAKVQGLGAGLICPNPKCSLTGRTACAPVGLPGSPISYIFACGECFAVFGPEETPDAARAKFLKASREKAWNDNDERGRANSR